MTHMGLYKIPKIEKVLKKVEGFNFRLAQILTNYPGYIRGSGVFNIPLLASYYCSVKVCWYGMEPTVSITFLIVGE